VRAKDVEKIYILIELQGTLDSVSVAPLHNQKITEKTFKLVSLDWTAVQHKISMW